jgi:hypothetical protein
LKKYLAAFTVFALSLAVSTLAYAQTTAAHATSSDSIRIGAANFTPGGFIDVLNVFRSTNAGSVGTPFSSIPFNNSIAGHDTEDRMSAQATRLSLKVDERAMGISATGYIEADFVGNDAANSNVSTNSNTFRLRLAFADIRYRKYEFAAGQMWSWITPNRSGVDSMSADIFNSLDEDYDFQVGFAWARQTAVRFILHPTPALAYGLSLENPDQYIGQSGAVTFPSAFASQLASQFDSYSGVSSAPALHPDLIAKIAFDPVSGSRHQHVELAAMLRGFRLNDLPTVSNASYVSHAAEGVGISGAVNLQLSRKLHFLANAYWSDGGGRYLFGMAPDLVVKPVNAAGATCSSAGGCDARISLVHSGAALVGFEAQLTPHALIFLYDGGYFAKRNYAADLTSATPSNIGFGGPNSSNVANRSIQEPTLGYIHTFWKNPQFGSLQLINQLSYVTRSPWFVAAGAPKNAHLIMEYSSVRYIFP